MTTLNKKSNMLSKFLFTVTLFIILLRKYMISILKEDIGIDNITSLLFYASIGLLFLQFIIKEKHNIRELIIFSISCLLYFFTREGSILVIVLLAISISDIEDKYVVKSYMLLTAMFVIGCMLVGNIMTDIAKNPEIHYRFVNGKYIARETFGFANPNSVFLFLLPIFAGYIFFRFDDYNKWDRIILIGTSFYIYKSTMSRTGFLTIILSLLLVDILKFINLNKYDKVKKIIKFTPIIFLIGSVIVGTVLKNIKFLNIALASRPLHWNAYLSGENSIFTLFGNNISLDMKLSHPLDSSYIYILSILGLLSLIFFMYLLNKGLDIVIKNDNKKYIAIIMMFLVYALAENILLEAAYNFTILLIIKQIIIDDKNNFTITEGIKAITNKR